MSCQYGQIIVHANYTSPILSCYCQCICIKNYKPEDWNDLNKWCITGLIQELQVPYNINFSQNIILFYFLLFYLLFFYENLKIIETFTNIEETFTYNFIVTHDSPNFSLIFRNFQRNESETSESNRFIKLKKHFFFRIQLAPQKHFYIKSI